MPHMRIDGHTTLVGLIGYPIEHTVSPAMHNAAFKALNLNWRYVPLPVQPGKLAAAIPGLVALGFRGANVTLPHKQRALRVLQAYGSAATQTTETSRTVRIDGDALSLGALNTIVVGRSGQGENKGDRSTLGGYNTDVEGFLRALQAEGFRPKDTSAVVVGAGGAARSVVFGLMRAGASRITVLNRTTERAEGLIAELTSVLDVTSSCTAQALPLTEEALVESTRTAQLLVNATSVGMWPHVDASVWPPDVPLPSYTTVFDLIYNPQQTKLRQQARAAGAHAPGGLEMLVQQGALALELWTRKDAPTRVMRRACERAMGAQGAP